MYFGALIGISMALLLAGVPRLFPEGLGWSWLIGGAVLLVLGVVTSVALNWMFELLEYLAFAGRRCPQCGARRWSWGFRQGFGL
jgi:hypothetical protein